MLYNVTIKDKTTGKVLIELDRFPSEKRQQEQALRNAYGPGRYGVSWIDTNGQKNSRNAYPVRFISVFVGDKALPKFGRDITESNSERPYGAQTMSQNDAMKMAVEVIQPYLLALKSDLQTVLSDVQGIRDDMHAVRGSLTELLKEVDESVEMESVQPDAAPLSGDLAEEAPKDDAFNAELKQAIGEFMAGKPVEQVMASHPALLGKFMQ